MPTLLVSAAPLHMMQVPHIAPRSLPQVHSFLEYQADNIDALHNQDNSILLFPSQLAKEKKQKLAEGEFMLGFFLEGKRQVYTRN